MVMKYYLIVIFIEPCAWNEWSNWSSCTDACPKGDGPSNFPADASVNRSRSCDCPHQDSLACPTEDDSSMQYLPDKIRPETVTKINLCVDSDCPRK